MKPLVNDHLLADPRVREARRLMLQAVREHQQSITAIRPPDPERKIAYETLVRKFGEQRGGSLFFPYLGSGMGNGPFVELADGSVKFDLISGIGVHHFGHGHPVLLEAGLDAAIHDTVMQGNLQQNAESADLAEALLERARPDTRLAHCFLTSSGAMANENALKIAFQKRPGATRILAFEHAFAGRTLALASITDKAAYRMGLPTVLEVDYLPFLDAARPAESIERALAAFQEVVSRYPGRHAALWCEFVQGEGGFHPGCEEFFSALCAEARAQHITVVADEVQTFGRTTRLFAFQHFGLERFVDIVTTGKMLQACATLFTGDLRPGPGLLSQTFTASTSAIVAANVILRDLLGASLFGPEGGNAQVNARFSERFAAIARAHPEWLRGPPYGLGAMIACTPFDGSEEKVKKLVQTLFANGVIAFYNGAAPTRLRFLPPVPVLTDAHIHTVCDILETSLAEVAATGL